MKHVIPFAQFSENKPGSLSFFRVGLSLVGILLGAVAICYHMPGIQQEVQQKVAYSLI